MDLKNRRGNVAAVAEAERKELRGELAVARGDASLWQSRAERVRGENGVLRRENERLLADNARLAERLVEMVSQIATRPAPAPPPAPPAPDVASVLIPALAEFRKAVQPEIHYSGKDAADEQRRGINWADQGLDNTGNTPESLSGPFDDEPISVPDYVLDVESLTPNDVKGTRGGWYNPQKPA